MNLVTVQKTKKLHVVIRNGTSSEDQTIDIDNSVKGLFVITVGSNEDKATAEQVKEVANWVKQHFMTCVNENRPIIVNHSIKVDYLRLD